MKTQLRPQAGAITGEASASPGSLSDAMNSTLVYAWMNPWARTALRYATAVVSTGGAIWGRSLLDPWLQEECPFSLFYLSVLATAWMAGTGPAVLAIFLGSLAAAHFFIPPSSSPYIEDFPSLVQLSIYVLVNLVATLLFSRVERQRALAEKRSAENSQLSESLREADERKDEFLALLAHELRNPLAPIRSSVALMERKKYSPDVAARACGIIQRQVSNLVRITDDLLDVSRFCRGKIELQMQRLDVREAIHDAVEMTESLILDRSHRFQLLVPDRPVLVEGDRVRLAQMTANLLGNAAKYTPVGGRITLQVEAADAAVTISVSDNGIGFAPSEAERILQPFTQIDTSRTREYGGLGLGLSIVNRLVALHHGTLVAQSRGPGLGSRFTITLPAVANPESAACDHPLKGDTDLNSGGRQNDSALAASGDDQRARRVLLVEDNPDAGELLVELFEAEGFEVSLARDGMEALQEARRMLPDVIFLDIGLPGMDGYEIARRLRRSSSAEARLIAVTGWGGASDRELARQAGFDAHLVKPVPFHELLRHAQKPVGEETACEAAAIHREDHQLLL
ncbi:MAG: ATP-binding protein [Planctomycetaceae bacterium]